MKTLALLAVIVAAFSFSVPAQKKEYLLQGSIAVPAGKVWRNEFWFGERGGMVQGRFRAEGGSNDDIYCYIVTPDDYENMKNGNEFRSYYSSGKVTVANINLQLPAGSYVLASSNAHSLFSTKTVYGEIWRK